LKECKSYWSIESNKTLAKSQKKGTFDKTTNHNEEVSITRNEIILKAINVTIETLQSKEIH
jgi:hypothetical protein